MRWLLLVAVMLSICGCGRADNSFVALGSTFSTSGDRFATTIGLGTKFGSVGKFTANVVGFYSPSSRSDILGTGVAFKPKKERWFVAIGLGNCTQEHRQGKIVSKSSSIECLIWAGHTIITW